MGCLRLLFFQLWKVILAALIALVFARVDSHVEARYPDSAAGKAWRAYRSRGKKKAPESTSLRPRAGRDIRHGWRALSGQHPHARCEGNARATAPRRVAGLLRDEQLDRD